MTVYTGQYSVKSYWSNGRWENQARFKMVPYSNNKPMLHKTDLCRH